MQHAERADHRERNGLMGLRERKPGNEQDRADGEDDEMGDGELALGELGIGAVDEPEQHHRGEADQVDMRVHGRELEMLAHSHPDAEGEAENPAEQPDQNEPAVDVLHVAILPELFLRD